MTDFTGFPKQTLTFLRVLGRNNTKAWFDAHRGSTTTTIGSSPRRTSWWLPVTHCSGSLP